MNHIEELLHNKAPKDRQIVASGENHWLLSADPTELDTGMKNVYNDKPGLNSFPEWDVNHL